MLICLNILIRNIRSSLMTYKHVVQEINDYAMTSIAVDIGRIKLCSVMGQAFSLAEVASQWNSKSQKMVIM